MTETVDFVVIGGGSAGCVMAGRLSEQSQFTTCLLEAGGRDDSMLVQCPAGIPAIARLGVNNWHLQTVPQAGLLGRRGYQPRGKVLGGSSSVNAMIYLRGQPQDYDWWEAQGNPGWNWEDVKPWFMHAENNTRGADAFHGDSGPFHVSDLQQPNPLAQDFVQAGVQAGWAHNVDFNGHTQEGVGLYQVTQKDGERSSTAKAYLTPALQRPNLLVRTGAQVLRIIVEHTDAGPRAVGVEYLQGGSRHTIMARQEVILSAGALLSPHLLLLSGIGPGGHLQEMGLETVVDLPGVGQHLHDHLDAILIHEGAQLWDSFGLSPRGAARVVQGAWEWQRQRTGILTTNFAEGGAFLRSQPEETLPDLQLHFVVGKLHDHGRKTVWGHGYSCHVCVLQPRSRGSVRLYSPDPLTAPAIDPAFLADDDDLQRMVRGVHITREILRQPALARHGTQEAARSAAAQSDAAIAQWIRETADTIYHPVGTCRMGSGALDVVDSRLHVHGVQGLRVVDASIFPRIISGNTNAPTVMVAERAAAWVLQAATQATVSSAPQAASVIA